MLPVERICNRSLAAIALIDASFNDPAQAFIRPIAEMQLAWDHILLWALLAAVRNIN
jgi:hypothetical protein